MKKAHRRHATKYRRWFHLRARQVSAEDFGDSVQSPSEYNLKMKASVKE